MGFLSGLLGPAASVVGGIFGGPVGAAIGGGLGSLLGGSGGSGGSGAAQSGSATTTQQQKMDPRIEAMLFGGSNGNGPQAGLLSQYQGMLNTPQSDAMKGYGQAAGDYLTHYGASNMGQVQDAAGKLIGGTQAPTMQPAGIGTTAWAVGNKVNAPGQNNVDLTGAYQNMVYGDPAANPYLTGAIGKGIDQSNNAFANMQTNATDNLTRNILPGIRSNAVLAGQYGGSRQGVAEGNAIGDFAKAQQQAISQFGQNNTDAAVAAQAGAFDNGQNRALSAMQGLGAQQYGVASQNANTANQAEFMNVNNSNAVTNGMADRQQAANGANLQAQLGTNGLNANSALAGSGLLNGLTGNAYTVGQNDQNYGINRAQQVNGLLAPYLSANQSNTMSQPLYSNPSGNALGGALAGYGLASSSTGKGLLDSLGSLFGPGTIGR